jgi:HlyD family type I secretion membrane fusion protein
MANPDTSQGTADARDRVVQFPERARSHGGMGEAPAAPADWRRTVRIGLCLIALTFGGAGVWAATAPLDGAVVARGTVVVESNRKIVEHLDGGSVTEIHVDNGDQVVPGQLLLRLDDTAAAPAYRAARARLDGLLARRARLVAERDRAAEIAFPDALFARRTDPAVAKILHGERRQFAERRSSLEGDLAIHRQRIAQLERKAEGLEAEQASVRSQAGLLREELSGLTELMEKGYYPRIRVLERRRELEQLQGRIGKLIAGIAETRASIGETRLRLNQSEQKFLEKVVADLGALDVEIGDVRERVNESRGRLNRTEVTAGFPGVVHALQVASPGAVIAPGGQILQIIPENDQLVLAAEVAPQDIDLVTAGMTADVRFTALASRTTPVVSGTVARVSPDRLVERDGERAYYSTRVTIPPTELQKLDGKSLKAGMPVEVMINTGERTLVDYLWKPIADAMARGLIEQ